MQTNQWAELLGLLHVTEVFNIMQEHVLCLLGGWLPTAVKDSQSLYLSSPHKALGCMSPQLEDTTLLAACTGFDV
jgi:hypothetical protein